MPPAWPDSAAFWHYKRVIVTGSSGFLGFFTSITDLAEPIACPPAFVGRSVRNTTR
jgi:hypothetical protein